MKDTEEADLCAQVRGVGGDSAKGFGRRAEQDVIDFRLILIRDAGNLLRDGEDNVEILSV